MAKVSIKNKPIFTEQQLTKAINTSQTNSEKTTKI